jgi:hypothetical protein
MSRTPGPDVAADRRRAIRFPCPLLTWVQVVGTSPAERCRVRLIDISTLGVGFIGPEPLDPGVAIEVGWPLRPSGQRRIVQARVVRSEPLDSGAYLVGCQFDALISETQVGLLLARSSRLLARDA